jgi:hypothetical protein
MKKMILALAVILTFYSFTVVQPIENPGERETLTARQSIVIINGTSSTLQEAIKRLNSSGILIIKGKIIIDESITIPSNITLKVENTGLFELQGSSAFKIKGKVSAGLYPIFNGIVEFLEGCSTKIVKSEWFGNNGLAVNYALLSAGTIPVKITNDITVNRAILINNNQTLNFIDAIINTSSPMIGGAVIKNRGFTTTGITIIGGEINGTNLTNVGYDAIKLTNVNNALVKGVVCREVHTTASTDTGNIHLINCTNSTLQDVEVHDTWKMGIKVDGGRFNTIIGGYFTGTHDSAIGAINSPNMHVKGVYVDNCGTSNASNITMNLQNGIFENSISINASGSANGNGLTIGHEGYPAFNSIVRNNLFINNATKGVFIQGSTNKDISVLSNIIMHNGNGSVHSNSAGITTYYGVSNTIISNNEIIGNLRGVNMTRTSTNTLIVNNRITASELYGIDSDGLHSIVKDCDLSNATNIFHDKGEVDLKVVNNVSFSPLTTIDYRYLDALPWLTDLQRAVLKTIN